MRRSHSAVPHSRARPVRCFTMNATLASSEAKGWGWRANRMEQFVRNGRQPPLPRRSVQEPPHEAPRRKQRQRQPGLVEAGLVLEAEGQLEQKLRRAVGPARLAR